LIDTLNKWQESLGLIDWTITIEPILTEQVIFDDCTKEESYFIGIEKDHTTKRATIYHDIDLFEEAIVHELLHVKYPKKSEDWVNQETERLLN